MSTPDPQQADRPAAVPLAGSVLVVLGLLLGGPALTLLLRTSEDAASVAWQLGAEATHSFTTVILPPWLFVAGVVAGLVTLVRHRRRRPTVMAALLLVALAAGLLITHRVSVERGRSLARRYFGGGGSAKCASHLSHLGMALYLYAEDHGGSLPATLDIVVTEPGAMLSPDVLVCPWDDTRGAGRRHGDLPSSFAYSGAGWSLPLDSDLVLVEEDPSVHDGEGGHVLFGDGRVQWVPAVPPRQGE